MSEEHKHHYVLFKPLNYGDAIRLHWLCDRDGCRSWYWMGRQLFRSMFNVRKKR